jgi:rare lipoprotein A
MRPIIAGAIALFISCAAAQAQSWTGKASFYKARGDLACAHRSLPFGTRIVVTNLSNNHSLVLTVNDRGPYIKGRIIDVSAAAAHMLGFRHRGLAQVKVSTIGSDQASG